MIIKSLLSKSRRILSKKIWWTKFYVTLKIVIKIIKFLKSLNELFFYQFKEKFLFNEIFLLKYMNQMQIYNIISEIRSKNDVLKNFNQKFINKNWKILEKFQILDFFVEI